MHRRTEPMGAHAVDTLAASSGMRLWNSTGKILFALGTLLLCLALDRPAISLGVIAGAALMQCVAGGLSLRRYLRVLRTPVVFLLLAGLALACELAWMPVGRWNLPLGGMWVCVSPESLRLALGLSLRALGAVSALLLLALTTPAGEWTAALRRVHVPELIIELMYLIYRFIFLLLDTWHQMQNAAAARAGWRGFRTSCRTFAMLAGGLLTGALRRSRVFYQAMAARGYAGGIRFLEDRAPLCKQQVAWMAGMWGMLLVLLWLS